MRALVLAAWVALTSGAVSAAPAASGASGAQAPAGAMSAAPGVQAPAEEVAADRRKLIDRMRAAGLEAVEPLAGTVKGGTLQGAVRGLLSGTGRLRVLLLAGCSVDTVAGQAAAVAAALGAAADLGRTPRRHTLELVLCPPRPGDSVGPDSAARGWLSGNPEAAARDRVLAVLELDGVAAGGGTAAGRAAGLAASGRGLAGRWLTPAWLAHAVVAGARAAGADLAFGGRGAAPIGSPPGPLLGQMLTRLGGAQTATGASAFLAAGVPAVRLVGGGAGGGAGEWPTRLAGIVRRLDALAGRPRDDDAYLALAGRVWSRRDLYWVGLAVWVALLATGLPGDWRGAGSRQRRQRGRRYLPGFAFRMLFLALLLLAPAETLVLIVPSAVLGLVTPRRRRLMWVGRLAAAAPAVALAGVWVAEVFAGRLAVAPAEPLRLALVLAGVGLGLGLVGRPRPVGAAADDDRAAPRSG